MLYRASIRFLVMILVLAGVRLGACGPVKHTNEGPLPVSATGRDEAVSDENAYDRAERRTRERIAQARADGVDGDEFREQIREETGDVRADIARHHREMSSEELLRALARANDRGSTPEYHPGEPMSDTRPSR